MIIVRSPLRITLGGGGTDLESYYSEYGGFLLSAAINRYVYVNISTPFDQAIKLKYSEYEEVKNVKDIKHPIIRSVLDEISLDDNKIEITTTADLPSNTGLGSSSSFTTALIKALYANKRMQINKRDLAELACKIEIDKLRSPIGKQDQYISSYGGIRELSFSKNGDVDVKTCNISQSTINKLEDSLVLYFTKFSRDANIILKEQDKASKEMDSEITENLHLVKELGIKSKDALEENNINLFGEIMKEHWIIKKKRSKKMSNDDIDKWYSHGINNGAIGGKLVGAGAGGFLLFVTQDKIKLRDSMKKFNLNEVQIKFNFEGTKLVMAD